MSLAIDVDKIKGVCIAGHWYDVLWKDDRGAVISTFLLIHTNLSPNEDMKTSGLPIILSMVAGLMIFVQRDLNLSMLKTENVISGPSTSIDAVMT